MRDYLGYHVSDIEDGVHVSTWAHGSFAVHYADNVDKIVVEVRKPTVIGGMSMQLTLEQATVLRELIEAGIADAVAAKAAAADTDSKAVAS